MPYSQSKNIKKRERREGRGEREGRGRGEGGEREGRGRGEGGEREGRGDTGFVLDSPVAIIASVDFSVVVDVALRHHSGDQADGIDVSLFCHSSIFFLDLMRGEEGEERKRGKDGKRYKVPWGLPE